MTKADLINAIAEKGEYSKKDADKALATVTAAITDALANGEKIQLIGFGTFKVNARKKLGLRNKRFFKNKIFGY